MRPSPPGVLLALLSLASASLAQAQLPPCQAGARRIELMASSASPQTLCVSPGLSTTLLFDRALAEDAVVLEGRERFLRVEAAGSVLVLIPSEQLKPGERLRLQVRFAQGGAPESADFMLVAHRGQADRQVEVSSAPRSAEACQMELQRKEEELQRCLSQRALPAPAQATLAGLFASKLIDRSGISMLELDATRLPQLSEDELQASRLTLYRSRKRLAMQVELQNTSKVNPWTLGGASLQGQRGEVWEALSLMQPSPVPPGDTQPLWLELAAPAERAQSTFTLKLWDAGKKRTLTLQGVQVP